MATCFNGLRIAIRAIIAARQRTAPHAGVAPAFELFEVEAGIPLLQTSDRRFASRAPQIAETASLAFVSQERSPGARVSNLVPKNKEVDRCAYELVTGENGFGAGGPCKLE